MESLSGRRVAGDDPDVAFNRMMIARECGLVQIEPGVFPAVASAPGAFAIGWRGAKLIVTGWVTPTETEVLLSFNGRIVAVTKAAPSRRRRGLNAFRFTLGASTLALARRDLEVRVSSRLGLLAAPDGALSERVTSPRGRDEDALSARLSRRWTIDKWGQIALPISEKEAWKQAILRRYGRVRDFMQARFDIELMLVAGSLLGLVREGDFIAHDDDFDAGYFSRQTSAEAVRDEMFEIIRAMKQEAIRVKPAHTRRFFQIGPRKAKLDIFPAWFEDGHVWMPNSQMMPAGADLMSPASEADFLGSKVLIPNQPEAYLALHYGASWRTPDRHYREVKKRGVMTGMRRVALTDEQIEALGAQVAVKT